MAGCTGNPLFLSLGGKKSKFFVQQPICLHLAAVHFRGRATGEVKQQERGLSPVSFMGIADARSGAAVGN